MQTKNNKNIANMLIKHLLALLIISMATPATYAFPEKEPPNTSEFTGSSSCMGCHQEEYQTWLGSDHQKAMQNATQQTVLGNFADQSFQYNDFQYQFHTEDNHFFIVADDQQGSALELHWYIRFNFYMS